MNDVIMDPRFALANLCSGKLLQRFHLPVIGLIKKYYMLAYGSEFPFFASNTELIGD